MMLELKTIILTNKQKRLFIFEECEEKFAFSVQNFRLQSFTLSCKGHNISSEKKKRCAGENCISRIFLTDFLRKIMNGLTDTGNNVEKCTRGFSTRR